MRGNEVSECEVDKTMKLFSDKASQSFVEWIPNRLMSSVCRSSAFNLPMTGGALLNSTSVIANMQRVVCNFEKMYYRKAYVHWYTQEGMDVQEFDESLNNLKDLISEYEQYQDSSD